MNANNKLILERNSGNIANNRREDVWQLNWNTTEKAIKRFTELLKHSANKFEISSLAKQLQLISNLFEQYFSDVPVQYWENFFIVLQAQEETLRNIIKSEEGLRKKKKCEDALNALLLTMNNYLYENELKAA